MISSLAGDIIGSAFEFDNDKKDSYKSLFCDKSRFTDDTVLLIATASAILNNNPYSDAYYEYAVRYPKNGYGKMFSEMVAKGKLEPYNSYGNGSAMRVGPIGWAFDDKNTVFEESKKSAICTHSHVEGTRGAQFVAYAIWALRSKTIVGKENFLSHMTAMFGYDLTKKCDEFEKKFDVTCQGTIPRCVAIFMETDDFESAMRKAISMGGDVDTNCCIVGSICDIFYGLPNKGMIQAVYEKIPKEMAEIVTKFTKKYIKSDFEPPLFVDTPSFSNSILSLEI